MARFKSGLVLTELSILLLWTRAQTFLFGFEHNRISHFIRWIPVLSEEQRLTAVRRLNYFRPNCLAWSVVAHAYLRRCGENSEIRFAASPGGGNFQAHAFLKFADGKTVGERVGFVELN